MSAYVNSPYMIDVVVVLLFALAWLLLWRSGRKIIWPRETRWRNTVYVLGWISFVLAVLVWVGLLTGAVGALRSDVETDLPKKASLMLLLLGGFVYFFFVSLAATAFKASHGSARDDIMKEIGR